jgi:hypothetical protein
MAAHAGTLRSTAQIRQAAQDKHVIIRALLVILKSATSAVVFSLLLLFEPRINPLLMVFALLCATGLVAGLTARNVLKAFHGIWQFLVALLALFGAMIALNYTSRGVLGIDYLTLYHGEIDTLAYIQVGISFVVMLLGLTAWRKRKGSTPAVYEEPSPPRSYRSPEMQLEAQQGFTADRVRVTPARRLVNLFSSQPSHPFVNGGSRPNSASPPRGAISLGGSRHRLKENTKIRARRSTLILKGKKPVKFIGAEEHRCPYCLEIVVENDPRGIEICPICHTYHHADCWAVTGVCQVPHANG